jgi:hypothetical protein
MSLPSSNTCYQHLSEDLRYICVLWDGSSGIDRGVYAGISVPHCQLAQWLSSRIRSYPETECVHSFGFHFCRYSSASASASESV